MTTRIRYKKNDNMYTSKPMLAGNDMVVVNIMPVNNLFTIVTLEDGRVLANGEGKSFNVLKINAKKALKGLGVQFADEVRIRDKEVEGEDTSTDPEVTAEGLETASDDAPMDTEEDELPPGFTKEDLAEQEDLAEVESA